MKRLLLSTLFLSANIASAITPVPGEEQSAEIIYINANIHMGNGSVLKNAQFAFNNGKITRAGYYKAPYTGNEIDLKGQHIYPGLILANTNLGLTEIDSFQATRDSNEAGQINPNVRSLTSYNTDSERIPVMRFNGILLAQPTPQGGLVSGTSSVVQLDAWNWEDAVVKADDAIHVNWPAAWGKRFDPSTSRVKLSEDKKYPDKIKQIKQLFIEAKNDSTNTNVKLNAVKPVFSGSKKVYIHSNNPKAIIESITFFKDFGINNLVLVTQQAVDRVIDFVAENNIPVIIRSVHELPNSNDDSLDVLYRLPHKLHQAGILTAISYAGSMESRNLAFTAGSTVAYGNEPNTALSMITLNPAKILGIDKTYGSLEIGKSATFFITEGDALDMRGNQIKTAYIDGRKIELNTRQQKLYETYKNKLLK